MEKERDILKYIKGTAPIEERRKFLFDLIDKLDKESLQLFSDVVDLSEFDFYKNVNLTERIEYLDSITADTIDGFEYLSKIDISSYNYAVNRYRFKLFLSMITSGFAFTSSIPLGLISFILLNKKASKDYTRELSYIGTNLDYYDDEKLNKIANTIANSSRIYNSKANSTKDIVLSNVDLIKGGDDDAMVDVVCLANMTIIAYQNGDINLTSLDFIPDVVRNVMISLLQYDLNEETNDLNELLEKLKEKNESNLQFVKQYKKTRNNSEVVR